MLQRASTSPAFPLTGVPISDPTFLEGIDMGQELALGDTESGRLLQNETDLWRFLREECSPKTIARERQSDKQHGKATPTVPFPMRLGVLVGYLTTAFAIQGQHVRPDALLTKEPYEQAHCTLYQEAFFTAFAYESRQRKEAPSAGGVQ